MAKGWIDNHVGLEDKTCSGIEEMTRPISPHYITSIPYTWLKCSLTGCFYQERGKSVTYVGHLPLDDDNLLKVCWKRLAWEYLLWNDFIMLESASVLHFNVNTVSVFQEDSYQSLMIWGHLVYMIMKQSCSFRLGFTLQGSMV